MAQVKYTDFLIDSYLDEAYGGPFYLDVKQGKTATFEDVGYHSKIILSGENMKDDSSGLTAGTFDKAVFVSASGDTMATVTGHFEAKEFSKALIQKGPLEATEVLFDGNDTFTGSNGYDRLWGFGGNDKIIGGKGGDELAGGTGNDVLIGGSGNDVFIFGLTDGKDVIKDFDADGGAHHQDLVYVLEDELSSFNISHDKHGDAMLKFFDGSTLTFEGVPAKHITMDDIHGY